MASRGKSHCGVSILLLYGKTATRSFAVQRLLWGRLRESPDQHPDTSGTRPEVREGFYFRMLIGSVSEEGRWASVGQE
jgi:hypothetical protein